jgi:hypothetical protein
MRNEYRSRLNSLRASSDEKRMFSLSCNWNHYKKGDGIVKSLISTLFVLFVLLNSTVSFADSTWVHGTLVNQTWTPENSPYCVDGNIRVAGLEIKPSVQVVFFGAFVFEIAGKLTAIGTEQDSIIFTKAHQDTAGWWGIFFNRNPSGSKLAYCRIQGSDSSGIRVDHSTPSIKNCTITHNSSTQEGGGINVFGTSIFTLDNCAVTNNSVSNGNIRGGGIYVDSSGEAILTGCIIANNSVTGGSGSIGGGIYVFGRLTLNNCTVNSNSVYASAGVFDDCYSYAGGIYIKEIAMLFNCIVDGNSAHSSAGWFHTAYSYGGGIYAGGTSTLKNCIISYNSVSGNSTPVCEGGGFYSAGSDTSILTNCTIAYNTNQGLRRASGTVKVRNSILWENSSSQISGATTVTYSDVQGSYPGEGNIDWNPIFESDSNLIIVPGSCCVDSGDSNPIYNDLCFPPSLGTVRNDMGAHGGPFGCGWLDEPWILCPPGPIDTLVYCPSEICVSLSIHKADTVNAGAASWDNDTLCFTVDTSGSYIFTVIASNCYGDDTCEVTVNCECTDDVEEIPSLTLPNEFSLGQNYPNPFNLETRIQISLAKSSFVTIRVFNILGEQVRTLVCEPLKAGYKVVTWDGKDKSGVDVASGIYFYQLKTKEFNETKKMMLLK